MKHSQHIFPGFSIRSESTFDSFYTSTSVLLLKHTLLDLLDAPMASAVYICGDKDTGKSHLLQAVSNKAHDLNLTSLYLPLAEMQDFPASEVLEGLENIDVLCVDDVHCVAGNAAWEEQLFHLYNRRMQAQTLTIYAANELALSLPLHLPDLKTRFTACLSFQLPILLDEEKIELLQHRSKLLGMNLNESCAQFIVNRSDRDLGALLDIIAKLDRASLQEGRKITVPFIKEIMQW